MQGAAQPNVEDQPDNQEKASQKSAERLPDDIKTNEEEKKDEELQAGREDQHRDIEEDEAICEEVKISMTPYAQAKVKVPENSDLALLSSNSTLTCVGSVRARERRFIVYFSYR